MILQPSGNNWGSTDTEKWDSFSSQGKAFTNEWPKNFLEVRERSNKVSESRKILFKKVGIFN